MRHECSECGAALDHGLVCRDYFHELLALESRVPGGVDAMSHFFGVATYNLQHPRAFVPEVIEGLRSSVADALAGRADVAELRRRAGAASHGAKRVLRDSSGSHDDPSSTWPRRWPMTIRDVCAVEPEAYPARVRAWAHAVLALLARDPKSTRSRDEGGIAERIIRPTTTPLA